MSWEMQDITSPKARKEYHCQASDWIENAGFVQGDIDEKDWATWEKAKAENYRILKGATYVKVTGKWDGDFSTFRARKDLDAICQKYDLYGDW